MRQFLYLAFLFTLLATAALPPLLAGKKKNKDEITQVLALPKDPPAVAVGSTGHLSFQVSPLSAKGLLSAQTRDAVKTLLKLNGGAPIVHIRAFVAGSGDMRRVPQIVSEVLTDKKMDLPSVSVIQAGALGMVNAQVVLEAVSSSKKELNPGGLRFVPGEVFTAADPLGSVQPLLTKSMDSAAARLEGSQPLRVTCFVSSTDNNLLPALVSRFPGAAVNVVQTQRAPVQALASCEAVGQGGPVTASRLAFTGTQIAFGFDPKDAALAFQRFDQQITQAGSSPQGIVLANLYARTNRVADLARKLRPALSDLPRVTFEGLASMDGSFAVDAVAIAR